MFISQYDQCQKADIINKAHNIMCVNVIYSKFQNDFKFSNVLLGEPRFQPNKGLHNPRRILKGRVKLP